MKNDLVSIITPLYNKEHYIAETIRSVQAQTYTEWEMIIVDDCSTDQSARIVEEFCKDDSRIRYYKNLSNSGAAESRNRALELAEGRYIAFLDADDLWAREKLQKQISYMKKNECAFSYTACGVVDEKGNEAGKVRYIPEKVDYRGLLKGNCIPCLTVVLDKMKIPNIRMEKMGHEDYALWLKILQRIDYAQGINEVMAYYREYGSSLSGNKLVAAKWTWKIYREHLKLGIWKSCYYFGNYLLNAVMKRV